MDVSRPGKGRLRVAVTGAGGDYGKLLLPRLERDPDVESILAVFHGGA